LVTTTSTAPAAWAGVVTVIVVGLTTFTPVPADPSKVTAAPGTNPVPEMVTGVPPAVGPAVGTMPDTVGGAIYVNPLVRVPYRVSGLVTTTSTAPAAWAGVVAVIVVGLTTFTLVPAVPSKVTVAPATNPVPEMVTGVPPAVGPLAGTMPDTVGGAMYVNSSANVPDCVSGLVTTTATSPAAWAGVVTVIVVGSTTFTPVPAVPPKVTVAPGTNPVPVMVTTVPPAVDPLSGEISVTVGGSTYVYEVVAVPPGAVTVTTTVPEPAGAVILIVVAVVPLMVAVLLPNVTVEPARLVPVMLTRVPPAAGPDAGEMPVMVGAAAVTVIPVDNVCPSTVAETVLVPALSGVNVVVPAPDEKKLPVGATFPVPPVTANVAGTTSGTKMPPPAVFVPTEL